MKSRAPRLRIVSRAILSVLAMCNVGPVGWAETNLLVIAMTNVWRYNETDHLDGTGWEPPDCADSGWRQGPGAFGCAMTVLVPDPLVITQQPASQTVGSNSSVTFTVGIRGSIPRYQWQFNGNNISLATNGSYTIPSVQLGNAGVYRVIVSNPINTVTSQVATLTVTTDMTPPQMISAGAQEATQPPYYILIRFDERVSTSSATKSENYAITELGTTNQLVVSNAQVNANLVRLTVSPLIPWAEYYLTVNNVADLYGNVILPDSQIAIVRWQEPQVSTNNLWSWSEGFDLTGQDWTSREYDESTNNILHGGQWKIPDRRWAPVGRGVFYFYGFDRPDVSPLNTVLSIGSPTYYFRTRFVRTSTFASIILTHLLDDGAVVYLNGAEIYRINMPSGPPGYETLATAQRGTTVAWMTRGEIIITNLVPGTNVLAAELHPNNRLAGLEPGIAFGLMFTDAVTADPPTPLSANGSTAMAQEVASFSSPPGPTTQSGSAPIAPVPTATGGISNVIQISIDGGAAYWIERHANDSPAVFTNFHRLLNEGASTFNARCDPMNSDTIPNHVSMFTGRPVFQPTNMPPVQHGYRVDTCSIPDDGVTIHNYANPDAPYKRSVFDVIHDHGLSTEFLSGKADRMAVCQRSYSAAGGAPDSIPPDDGPNKIDYSIVGNSFAEQLVTLFLQNLRFTPPKHYSFLHFVDPQEAGQSAGWGTDVWSNSIVTVDRQIGRILDAAQNHPALSNHTAIIVTADHGGDGVGSHSHMNAQAETTFRIPFFVWGPGVPAGADLYDLFSNRTDPGTNWLDYTAVHQPIRNGDSGNLALNLLGLPPIPGSFMSPTFEWDEPRLTLQSTNEVLVISWSRHATNFQLEASETLADGATWETINEETVEGWSRNHVTLNTTSEQNRFYRLRRSAP